MASLRQYGIDTIDKLREEMTRLRLLSDSSFGKGTMLQVLFFFFAMETVTYTLLGNGT